MKNITIIIALIAALAVFSCPTGDGGGKTLGKIQITLYGEPVGPDNPAETGTTLVASYSGKEAVSYQWKWTDNSGVTTVVGENESYHSPDDPGKYTVTVSAPGYPSRTSAPVDVTGQPVPPLPGTLAITVDGTEVTAAETGDVLTAVYTSGSAETVTYRWYKDGAGITPSGSTTYTTYTPTEKGSYSVKAAAAGYRASISTVAVTGETLITITFDQNDGGYTRPTIIIAPGAAIGTLPAAPTRNGFSFVGWYTALSGGTKLTEATTFTATTTVYARWSFSGGVPYINDEDESLVHENPLMEAGLQFAGEISSEDGAISFTGGAFQYKFPTGYTISDYAYFIVKFELRSESGSGSGVRLRQYNNTTAYAGVSNEWPWFSNESASGIRFPVTGDGGTGGFSMLYNGGTTTIEVRITSITFYKLPQYTVTFDIDGGDGTAPTAVQIYEGSALGAQFPAAPTKTGSTFFGWRNAAGAMVVAITPIMGNWTLTAQWGTALGAQWSEFITTTATSAPVYGFSIPAGGTLGDYDRIIFQLKSDAAVSGRLRAWGVYPLSTWTNVNSRPGMDNAVGTKLLTNPGLDSFSHNGTWVEYVLPLNNTGATGWTPGATGIVAIAFGLIPQSGGSGTRPYYVKDIVLSNEDKTKSVSALRPDDAQLWSGSGASAYVTQNGGDTVSRQILPYE